MFVMKKKSPVVYLLLFAIAVSAFITIWSYIRVNSDQKDYKRYRPAMAVITAKLPGRISSKGAKPTRYHLSFTTTAGKLTTASNIELGDELNQGDSLIIYYDTTHPSENVVKTLP